jgi:hypothetical protein
MRLNFALSFEWALEPILQELEKLITICKLIFLFISEANSLGVAGCTLEKAGWSKMLSPPLACLSAALI